MMKKVYRKKLDAKAKAVKAKIQKTSGGDQFKNLQEWVTFYKENERLPNQKITCATCKKKQTSMFGDNLRRQLAKPEFKTIELLLTKFECSDCRKAKAPAKEVKVPKVRKAKAGDIKVEDNTASEYMTREAMEDRKEKIRATLPAFKVDAKPVPIDFSDKEAIIELTKGACQRPDIYLDAGCKYCPLVNHCACASKDLKRDIVNDGRSSRKRK